MSAVAVPVAVARPRRSLRFIHDPRVTPQLIVGIVMLVALIAFAIIGPLLVDPKQAVVGALTPRLSPSAAHFLGTDTQGRDLWTELVLGTPNSLKIGLIAGFVGIGVGLLLGLIAGFVGGATDTVIRIFADALLTVPAIAVLVVLAANVEAMTVEMMGVAIALLAWMFPTRVIRSQVLTIRERSYVEIAKSNGVGILGLIFKEVMPNLMPWVGAAFVGTVAGAILAAVGLEAIGLGAKDAHTLGVNIYWAQFYFAMSRGFWWWWIPPIIAIAYIFMTLYMVSAGMDRFANPRLRQE
jgi:peptide/nickel transport system permease protein